MRATRRLNRNLGETARTLFGCKLGLLSLFFPLESIDTANNQKDRKGHYQEADDRVQKNAIVEGDRADGLSIC